jgi:Ca2+-dependent lipid-binding protein
MGNGAIGNGAKFKEFFKNVGTGIKDGLTTVVDVAKKIIGTSGVKDAINMGAHPLAYR